MMKANTMIYKMVIEIYDSNVVADLYSGKRKEKNIPREFLFVTN